MIELFWAELRREWTLLRRYAIETLSFLFGLTVAFYGLFQSAQYIAGPGAALGERLDAIVVGYVLWSLVVFILGDIAGGLQREAQTGTLEQLFLSPFGAPQIFIIRAVSNLILQLGLNLGILLIILLITGTQLAFPPILALPLMTVLLGAYGLALIMGSLALLLKRVQQVLGIFQFFLFFILMVPTESWAGSAKFLGWLLPMTPGAGLLRDVMARGQGLNWQQWSIALLNGVVYLVLGLWTFRFAEHQAKLQGKLAGY